MHICKKQMIVFYSVTIENISMQVTENTHKLQCDSQELEKLALQLNFIFQKTTCDGCCCHSLRVKMSSSLCISWTLCWSPGNMHVYRSRVMSGSSRQQHSGVAQLDAAHCVLFR